MAQLERGVNQDSIQGMNRFLLINLLRNESICPRVHLANLSGLKQATVTNIINDFIGWGLVKEVGFLVGNKGRRSIGIAINTDYYRVLGIRLARKYFSVGLFDLTGKLRSSKRVEIDAKEKAEDIFKALKSLAKKTIESAGEEKILAIGMAIPGPFMVKENRIALMTEVLGWNQISIKGELEEEFNLPVFLEHDANAGALAHLWHNEIEDKNIGLVYIAVGQGIGAGIVTQGEILRGYLGIAGEIGHTSINFSGPKCSCGNRGCLEKYCSSIAFAKSVNEAISGVNTLTFSEIKDKIKQGDAICLEKYEQVCRYLAVGVINVVNSFNPRLIVLGDEMAHVAPELMLKYVKEEAEKGILPQVYENLEIRMSTIKNDSILHGAAIVAINEMYYSPEKFMRREE